VFFLFPYFSNRYASLDRALGASAHSNDYTASSYDDHHQTRATSLDSSSHGSGCAGGWAVNSQAPDSSSSSSSRNPTIDGDNTSGVSYTHFKQKLVSVPLILFGLRLPGSIMTVKRQKSDGKLER
jgi:hypothetical protein